MNPERPEDVELKIKLDGGGSPDLVMALTYAWLGINEISHFTKPKPKYAPRALGTLLGHHLIEDQAAMNTPEGVSWTD